jgi:hypothetical protein
MASQSSVMKTRNFLASERERKRNNKRKSMSSPEVREKQRIAQQNYRKRLKIQQTQQINELQFLRQQNKELKNYIAYKKVQIESLKEQISELEEALEQVRKKDMDLIAASSKENNSEEQKTLADFNKRVQQFLDEATNYPKMVRFYKEEFEELVKEVGPAISETTFRGTFRKQRTIPTSKYSTASMVFITLFWLAHYPTLAMMSAMFGIHERSITQILKRTLTGMAWSFKDELKWPTDEEFERRKHEFFFFQNWDFKDAVCVVDGTEIRISRPSKEPFQKLSYSGKKKQHTLNILLLTWLNGEIFYFSNARVGSNDQSHFNEEKLRDRFIGKMFGVMGDGGFTFNRKTDTVQIIGYKPHRRRHGHLTKEEAKYNKYLSQMRVVVENTISRIKQWRIIKGVFRHWRNGEGQLNVNDILQVIVVLTNRKNKQQPIRNSDWIAPQWNEELAKI